MAMMTADEQFLKAAKRLGIAKCDFGDDWFSSYSPRNIDNNAEGQWCQWVHLARLILAHDKTKAEMPAHYRPYANPPHLYDEHHPDCQVKT